MRRARCVPTTCGRCSALPIARASSNVRSAGGGDIEAAFREFRDQYDIGADPIGDAERSCRVREFRHARESCAGDGRKRRLGETERLRGRDFAAKLSMRVLSRMWQMLLKGITEAQNATRPALAAEMVLVRIAYAADLPTPDEAIRAWTAVPRLPRSRTVGAARRHTAAHRGWTRRCRRARISFAPAPSATRPKHRRCGAAAPHAERNRSAARLSTFPEIVALAAEKRDLPIKAALENDVRLVRVEDGRLEVALEPKRRARWSANCHASSSSGPAGAGP